MGLRWIGRAKGSSGSASAVVIAGNAIAFLVGLPFALPVEHARVLDGVLVLGLGIVQIGVAYVFLIRAMRDVPALEASVLLLLEPALNPVWAWIIHGERPGPWSIAGGLIVLGATALKTWLDSRRGFRRRSAPPEP
jgi:drug/metabolite transporter (DMT)-like permease